MKFFILSQNAEKEKSLNNFKEDSRLAIDNEKKMKEKLELKNSELSKKLDTLLNDVIRQKSKIEELESKV